MRTGDRSGSGPQRGFVYLALLGLLALGGAALASVGTAWSTAAQREREAELRFRGEQIRQAIGRYRASGAQREWPVALADLLEDRRGGEPVHHLRRLWVDPFTGRPDWELIGVPAADGFRGVRSRSSAPRLTDGALVNRHAGTADDAGTAAPPARVSDWVFEHRDATPPTPPIPPAPPAARPGRPA